MRKFRHSFIINSNIEKAWKFHTNINHLKIITPDRMKIEVLKTTHNVFEEGAEVWLRARLITNSEWHSKITYLRPYEYVDEMLEGRFKIWKHLHKFNKIDNSKTEITDEIEFQLPYGIFGIIFENYVMDALSKIFDYRKQATMRVLDNDLKV